MMEIRFTDKLLRKQLLDLISQATIAAEAGLRSVEARIVTNADPASLICRLSDEERWRRASALPALSIELNEQQLIWALRTIARLEADQALLEDLVRRDAPFELIREHFRVGYRGFRRLRSRLGLPEGRAGRPALPALSMQIEVVRAFRLMGETQSVAVRYIDLAKRFPHCPLASIHRVLSENGRVCVVRRRPPRSVRKGRPPIR